MPNRDLTAIAQKQDEIHQHEVRLKCPDYEDKEWPSREIEMLRSEIEMIEQGRYGDIARCHHDPSVICLIAHRGFSSCTLRPANCGFSKKET